MSVSGNKITTNSNMSTMYVVPSGNKLKAVVAHLAALFRLVKWDDDSTE